MATRQIPWARVLVEGVVIVASILLAFGIDAWWSEREAAIQVREELQNVATELRANHEQAEFSLSHFRRLAAGAASILEHLEPGVSAEVTVPDTLAWLATSLPPSLDPSLGALDALIASGRLALVDSGLRARLSRLRSLIDDAEENQVRLLGLYDREWVPWLTQSELDWRPVMAVSNSFWTRAQRVADVPLESATTAQLPNTTGFRNYILARQNLLNLGASEWPGVIQEFEDLLAILEAM